MVWGDNLFCSTRYIKWRLTVSQANPDLVGIDTEFGF